MPQSTVHLEDHSQLGKSSVHGIGIPGTCKAGRMEEERSFLREFFSPALQGSHEMSRLMAEALGSNP